MSLKWGQNYSEGYGVAIAVRVGGLVVEVQVRLDVGVGTFVGEVVFGVGIVEHVVENGGFGAEIDDWQWEELNLDSADSDDAAVCRNSNAYLKNHKH